MKTLSLRSDVYPDILILDEILDSSIDNDVLSSMIDIIKAKQSKDDMKIYIISHRDELKNIDFSNVYNVENVNGFSKLSEEI
jgi:DNA repair exonuclease SbcCD ATPase subunit